MAEPRDNSGVAPGTVEAATGLSHDAADGDREAMTTPTSKRTSSPAFQFYVNDFLGSPKVQVMSATEVGAYVLLLLAEWNAGYLPKDTKRLAQIARMKATQFERMWKGPLGECFFERNGKLYNQRIEDERKKQADYRKQQSDRVNKRWENERNTKARNTTVLPDPYPSGNTLQSSSSSSSSERTKALDQSFQRFQEAYPAGRRQGGNFAENLYFEAVSSGVIDVDHLMAALENHKASEQWSNPKLIPSMLKWLQEQRWRQVLPSVDEAARVAANAKLPAWARS